MFGVNKNDLITERKQEITNKTPEEIRVSLEDIRKENEYRVPYINNTDEDFDKIDIANRETPASAPLNSFSKMMMAVINDKDIMDIEGNLNFLTGFNHIAEDALEGNLANFLIHASFENFCNMIDQIYYNSAKGFRDILDTIALKNIVYEELYTNHTLGNNLATIIYNYIFNPNSSGNMIIDDTTKFDEHHVITKYSGLMTSQLFYSVFCNCIEKAVNEVFYNVYRNMNYNAILSHAAEYFGLSTCPATLLPMYVTTLLKNFLLKNLSLLMGFLTDNVYINAYEKCFTSGYYNFGLIVNMANNQNNKDKE